MKLSIITINFNNIDGLKKTIESVVSQSYMEYEWIVVDGGSTDGSKDLIEQCQNHFSYWCSESDNGIYNAINKGLTHVNGNYVQFLNSGDWLYDDQTLEKAITQIDDKYDIYYGNMVQVNDVHKLNPISYPDELGFFFFPYNNICHQATFYRRALFDNNPYDESFSIIADWAMNLNLLFRGCTFKHLNQFVVYYDNRGRSSFTDSKHHAERTEAFAKYVPQQLQIDVKKYEIDYYFSRHRKSTRWIMDKAIAFSHWLDKVLSNKESKRSK
ncbi:MAG: glycosyltransferase [Bacteroidales bacterium]|nr:glycosyltransferase [Bacteroidales bacterium]